MPRFRTAHRRATTAMLLAVLLGVAASPASGAVPISVTGTQYEGGPVLAGDGRVVIGERLRDGGRRVIAINLHTRVLNEIARFPAPAEPNNFHILRLAGSGAAVTATLDTFLAVTDPTVEGAMPSLRSSRAFILLPSGPPLATCDPVNASQPVTISTASGDGFVALTEDDCGQTSAIHLRGANGTISIPVAGAGPFPPLVSDLRAAGPFVTWTERRLTDSGPTASFVAARGATGEVLLRAPVVRRYGLAGDGTIVAAEFGACSLRVVTLAPLAQRDVALPSGLCPGFFGAVAVAGGRAVYPVGGGYAISNLQGAAHLVEELAVDTILPAPIAFDGRTLVGVRERCHDELLLAVDTNVVAAAPLPIAVPPSTQTCPVRRAGSGRVRVAPDLRVSIRVRCPKGCRGTLRLVEQRRGSRERLIGSVDYASAGGSFVLRPRIARYARALAGCRGGLRAVAKVHHTGDRTKGLGVYRILSRTRCRHTGGPAFKAPASWPR